MSLLSLLLALTLPAQAADPVRGGDRTPPAEEPAPRTGGDERTGGGDRQPTPAPTKPAPEPDPTTATGDRNGGKKKKGKKGKKKKKKGYKIDSMNPLYGTLVYGPKLGTHHKYQGAAGKKRDTVVKKKDLPERKVDRKGTRVFGVRAGGMFYTDEGEQVANPGGAGVFGWRPFEAVGLQLELGHYADKFPGGATHADTYLGASGQLFVFPWNGVSPYVHLGVGQNFRGGEGLTNVSSLFGPNGGIGLQLAIGGSAALDLQGRIIGWTGQDGGDPTNPIAGQLNAGLLFHF